MSSSLPWAGRPFKNLQPLLQGRFLPQTEKDSSASRERIGIPGGRLSLSSVTQKLYPAYLAFPPINVTPTPPRRLPLL